MCPDPQILSVYLDGELPSPWRGKLEAHLRECSGCRARLDRYRRLSAVLAAAPAPGAAGSAPGAGGPECAAERVWARLQANHASSQGNHAPRRSVWRRSIAVPVPAAAAAAALLVAAFGFNLLYTSTGGAGFRSPVGDLRLPAEAEIPLAVMLSPEKEDYLFSDMSGVLQYLGETTGPVEVIQLPADHRFTSAGKPALVKAADYSGGVVNP